MWFYTSGTLLASSYSALEDLYKLEKFQEGKTDLDGFHKNILENNIWGFGVLKYTLHIASLNLAFHNPSTALTNLHFYAMPLE